MKIRTIHTCVKEGFKGVFRNGLMSLASVGTITACLIILGIVYCLVMNAQNFATDLDKNLGLVAFLEGGTTEAQVKEIENQLKARDDISDFHYVSADEAWKTFKSDMLGDQDQSGELMQQLDQDNPLKNAANFEIYPTSAENQAQVVEFLNTIPSIRKISYSANASQTLASFAKMVTYVGGALIAFLIFVALLLIANTVKLSVYIRRSEISIMKYIGATDAFVRLPFVIEGIVIGFLGALIPIVLIYFGYDALIRLMSERFAAISSLFTFLSLSQIMQGLIPIFLVLSIVVGVLGSSISMRKHLKV